MAQKVSLNTGSTGPKKAEQTNTPKRSSGDGLLKQNASPVVTIVLIILLMIGLGAGAFYAYNGGWKTRAQKEEEFKHVWGPIMAAKRGMPEALDKENAYRKEHGQELLKMPENRHQSTEQIKERIRQLHEQGKLGAPGQ